MAKARRNSRTQRARFKQRNGARTQGACETKKLRYPSRLEALIALADTGKESAKAKRSEKRIYKCQFCFGWHLTSSEKR